MYDIVADCLEPEIALAVSPAICLSMASFFLAAISYLIPFFLAMSLYLFTISSRP